MVKISSAVKTTYRLLKLINFKVISQIKNFINNDVLCII